MKAKDLKNYEILTVSLETEKHYSGCGVVAPSHEDTKTIENPSAVLWEVLEALEKGLDMSGVLSKWVNLHMVKNHGKGGMIAINKFTVRCKFGDYASTYKLEIAYYTKKTSIEVYYKRDKTPYIKEVKQFSPDMVEEPYVYGEEGIA